MRYARPVGWRGESYRHYLSSKGISSGRKRYYAAETALGQMLFERGEAARSTVGEVLGGYKKLREDRRQQLASRALSREMARASLAGERLGPLTAEEREMADKLFLAALEPAPTSLKPFITKAWSSVARFEEKLSGIEDERRDLERQRSMVNRTGELPADESFNEKVRLRETNLNSAQAEYNQAKTQEERIIAESKVKAAEADLLEARQARDYNRALRNRDINATREQKRADFMKYYTDRMNALREEEGELKQKYEEANKQYMGLQKAVVGTEYRKAEVKGEIEALRDE